jgi:hypothetical protein
VQVEAGEEHLEVFGDFRDGVVVVETIELQCVESAVAEDSGPEDHHLGQGLGEVDAAVAGRIGLVGVQLVYEISDVGIFEIILQSRFLAGRVTIDGFVRWRKQHFFKAHLGLEILHFNWIRPQILLANLLKNACQLQILIACNFSHTKIEGLVGSGGSCVCAVVGVGVGGVVEEEAGVALKLAVDDHGGEGAGSGGDLAGGGREGEQAVVT